MIKQKQWAIVSRLVMLVVVVCCYSSTIAQTTHTYSTNTIWDPSNPPVTTDNYIVEGNAVLTVTNGANARPNHIVIKDHAQLIVNNNSFLSGGIDLRSDQTSVINNSTYDGGLVLDALNSELLITNNSTAILSGITIYQTNAVTIEGNSLVKMAAGYGMIIICGQHPNTPGTVYGGRLTVNDSRIISNNSTQQWMGIFVHGGSGISAAYPYRDQAAGTTGKAYFNNAKVEGMQYGICNWAYASPGNSSIWPTDAHGWHSGGGLIQATNTEFNNNNMAAVFKRYQRHHANGGWVDDLSFFKDCTFYTDGRGYSPAKLFDGMINLSEVFGVKILGCVFYDEQSLKGPAIYSHVSQFTVDGSCSCSTCPATPNSTCIGGTFKKTTFNNVAGGIYVANAGNLNRVAKVQNTIFEGVRTYAVCSQNTELSTIRDNEIILAPHGSWQVKGIEMADCDGYIVESNKIGNMLSNMDRSYGILINSSDPYNNRIRKNTLGWTPSWGANSIAYALQSHGLNNDSSNKYIGLKFFCNNMGNNTANTATDITVRSFGSSAAYGISTFQGYSNNGNAYGAQNIFADRPLSTSGNQLSVTNSNGALLYQYYNVSLSWIEEPTDISTAIGTSGTNKFKDCDSLGGFPDLGINPNAKTYIDYTNLREGIDTELADPNVMYVNEETGYRAYDEYIDQYILVTEAMLRKYLDPEQTYTMEIEALTGDTLYHPDTLIYYPDSAMLVLQNSHHLYTYKVWLAGMYADAGDFATAYSTLADIPTNYALNNRQEEELEDYAAILAINEELQNNGNDWGMISNSDKEWLEDMAENSESITRYKVRTLLAQYEGLFLEPEGWEPEEEAEKPGKKEEPAARNHISAGGFAIYPNPTTGSLHITVPVQGGEVRADVLDITGRVLVVKAMLKGNNTIDISALLPGNYILKLYTNGIAVTTSRIVKQ